MKTKKQATRTILFVPLILVFTVIFTVMSSYDVFSSGTCPQNKPYLLFSYTSFTNAQAINSNAGNFAVCSSKAIKNTTASNIELITLSSSANAHVEENNQDNYNIHLWVQAAPGVNSISVYYQATNCNAGDECLFSISSDTNAHVANCTGTGTYTTKVCIGGVSCGIEGQGAPSFCNSPTNLNQIDGCCDISQYAPGFKCRKYETANYALRCCAEGSEIYSNCVWSMYDPNAVPTTFTYTTCTPQGQNNTDAACCNSPTDCVYNGICYTNNTLVNIFTSPSNTGLEHCTNNHWCPEGFYYNAIQNRCQPQEYPCYIGSLTNYCILTSYPYYNLNNPGCIQFGPINIPPESIPYEESCCFKLPLGIMNYYEWKNIQVYGTLSGNPQ